MKTAILSLVIAIAVAVLSLFQFDRYQKFSQATLLSLATLDKKVSEKLHDFDSNVSTILDQEQALLAKIQNTLWEVREAEYFVSLATVRLEVTRDVKATIELLTLAEQKINHITDPKLAPLRDALKSDLSNLKNITVPNIEEVYLNLSTVIEKSQKLSPRHISLSSTDTKSEITPTTETSQSSTPEATSAKAKTWQEKLGNSFEDIKGLVKIRRYSKPIEPLLTEAQQAMVQDILRSLLEQVRFSILSTEDLMFQKSILETKEWLSTYYESDDPEVKHLQDSLKSIADIQLRPSLPKLSSIDQFTALRQ